MRTPTFTSAVRTTARPLQHGWPAYRIAELFPPERKRSFLLVVASPVLGGTLGYVYPELAPELVRVRFALSAFDSFCMLRSLKVGVVGRSCSTEVAFDVPPDLPDPQRLRVHRHDGPRGTHAAGARDFPRHQFQHALRDGSPANGHQPRV